MTRKTQASALADAHQAVRETRNQIEKIQGEFAQQRNADLLCIREHEVENARLRSHMERQDRELAILRDSVRALVRLADLQFDSGKR